MTVSSETHNISLDKNPSRCACTSSLSEVYAAGSDCFLSARTRPAFKLSSRLDAGLRSKPSRGSERVILKTLAGSFSGVFAQKTPVRTRT